MYLEHTLESRPHLETGKLSFEKKKNKTRRKHCSLIYIIETLYWLPGPGILFFSLVTSLYSTSEKRKWSWRKLWSDNVAYSREQVLLFSPILPLGIAGNPCLWLGHLYFRINLKGLWQPVSFEKTYILLLRILKSILRQNK